MSEDLSGKTISRYRILSKLGEGGMGVVYKAEDTRLKRTVALKFLSPRLLDDAQYRARLLLEAQAAAALDHENICTIHEIDEVDGRIFIAMGFTEGRNLHQIIAGETLSLERVLDLCSQVADGLDAAHAKDIVHRDIKPANIMVTSRGVPKIMDFGLARVSGSTRISDRHVILGTASYMSPEQARGEVLDHRSDIWSLGVVFFEMLTGRLPFQGERPLDMLNAVCEQRPIPLSEFRKDLPPAAQAIVDKCLAKSPDQRYQSAAALKADLSKLLDGITKGSEETIWYEKRFDWTEPPPALPGGRDFLRLFMGILFLAAVVLGAQHPEIRRFLMGSVGFPAHKYLAVIPFTNVGGDPQNQALCDGLHEYLTSKLCQFEGLKDRLWVVPATDVRASEITSTQEARQVFKVSLAVTGSVQRSLDRFHVMLNVVDAKEHRQIDAIELDGAVANAGVLQIDALNGLISLLQISISEGERRRIAGGETTVPGAHIDYLKALGYLQGLDYLQQKSKIDKVDSAIGLLKQSVQADPRYALAYAALGQACWLRYDFSRESRWIEPAVSYCDSAIALDERCYESMITMGEIRAGTERPQEAVTLFTRALTLDPPNTRALYGLAGAYAALQNYDLAESMYRQAIDLRPDDWLPHRKLGGYYFKRGKFDKAIEEYSRVIELAPENFFRGYNDLGSVYLMQNRTAEARELFEKSLAIKPDFRTYSNLGIVCENERNYAEAVRMYENALAIHDNDYRIWGNLGGACAYLPGKEERAIEAWERAVALIEEQRVYFPRDETLLSHLANYYQRLEQDDKALEVLQILTRTRPDDVAVTYLIGQIYEKLGERDEALAWIEQALAGGYPLAKVESSTKLKILREDPRWPPLAASYRK